MMIWAGCRATREAKDTGEIKNIVKIKWFSSVITYKLLSLCASF